MTEQAISPLRRRMIEDMTIRKLAPKTQQGYIRTVKGFAAFLGRSPDTASVEDVRRFQLHLAESGAHVVPLFSEILFDFVHFLPGVVPIRGGRIAIVENLTGTAVALAVSIRWD